MISEAILRDKVGERLKGAKSVAPGVVRAERARTSGEPYAIYYFALSKSVKEWAERLEEFQDEVLGPGYYESGGHLRWNQYLYLLASEEDRGAQEFEDWKRVIEFNRSYARKFVLTEGQLDQALQMLEPPAEASHVAPRKDVVARWTDLLLEKKLGVILDQLPLTETVRAIAEARDSAGSPLPAIAHASQSTHPLSGGFLSALDIKSFREWPAQKKFERFGTVNLIVGGNGVGKTSFLETIEYLYCQENVRTDGVPPKAEVRGQVRGNSKWTVTRNPASVADGKQRNLEWYGQRDLRGSTLANSFARFNFLATDDAAMQGQKSAKISFEEMMARVVAGPQASELWDHICRLQPLLSTELSRAKELRAAAVDKQNALQVAIDSLRSKSDPSAATIPTLVQDLDRMHWRTQLASDFDEAALMAALGRAASIVTELTHPTLAAFGDSTEDIEKSLAACRSLSNQLDPRMGSIASNEATCREANAQLARVNDDNASLKQIQAAVQTGAFRIRERFTRIRNDLRRRRTALSPFLEIFADADAFSSAQSLETELDSFASELKRLRTRIDEAEREMSALRRHQSELTSLLSDIRTSAARLLEISPQHADCPVCSAKYEPQELRQRLIRAMSALGHDGTNSISALLAELQSALVDVQRRLTWLGKLSNYATTARVSKSESTEAIVQRLEIDRDQVEELVKEEVACLESMSRLAAEGFDDVNLDRLGAQAVRLQIDLADLPEVNRRITESDRLAKEWTDKAASAVKKIEELSEEIRKLTSGLADAPIEELVQAARGRLTIAIRAHALVSELHQMIDTSKWASFADCRSALHGAQETVEKIARTRREARESASVLKTSEESLKTAKREVEHWILRASRFNIAAEVVDTIVQSESLANATDQELAAAQAEINVVFRRIHSPQEFSFRRDTKAPLTRDATGAIATLRDMSTGQRAALVMSIFLAMNARLQAAPPIMLLDDPVAHIDDFNALSFLDHLRDVAIGGKRQIFYATADARMASLFEHKLAFLGDEFRRFDLSR